MSPEQNEEAAILSRIRSQAAANQLRVTQHAQEEMVAESIRLEEVLEAINSSELLENYPEHRRGACRLLVGCTRTGRALHIVCTSEAPVLILITVYEPKPPKWVTTTQRR
jgi:hypothetical protein